MSANKSLLKRSLGFLTRIKTRGTNFVYYKILSNKKTLLMIGGDDYPLLQSSLIHKYSSNWKIASLSRSTTLPAPTDLHLHLTNLTPETYKTIQTEIGNFTKLFDSIIVLPSKNSGVNIGDEEILAHFDSSNKHNSKIYESLLGYKFASRMLTPNGTLILTGSEKAFFGKKEAGSVSAIETGVNGCINSLVGERDYTDVNSCGLMVLTDDLELEKEEEGKQVVEMVKGWSEGAGLGYPGSFAKILRKKDISYPEFY